MKKCIELRDYATDGSLDFLESSNFYIDDCCYKQQCIVLLCSC